MKLYDYLKHFDTLIAAIIGFYVIYLFTSYSGVGISPDSIMYASTANNIQAHGTIITYENTPLDLFPVFYPFFLAVIQFVSRVDPIVAGALINQFLFTAVIFISGWILSKFVTHSILYKWLVLLAIILSPALLQIYTYLWSETLFILEVLLFILAYHHYLRRHSTKTLLFVAIIVAISCITRFAGVTLIGTGGLLLLLDSNLIFRKKVKHILIFTAVSISLLTCNLLFNRLQTGLSVGTREPSITPLAKNLYYTGTVLDDWGSLGTGAYPYAILLISVILLTLIAILLWKTYKKRINSYENIVIAFVVIYGLFIVLSATISRYERINSRLISPMFIPLLITCTCWVPDVLMGIRSKLKYVFGSVAIVAMLAFEYATLRVDMQRYDDEKDYGIPGFTDDSWNKSPFVKYLKTNKNLFKPGIPIYTNANEAVYLFTGMSSEQVPHRFFKKDVAEFFKLKHYYYIWFKTLDYSEIININDIRKVEKLNAIGEFQDGDIYEYSGE